MHASIFGADASIFESENRFVCEELVGKNVERSKGSLWFSERRKARYLFNLSGSSR
jgi:hypothetical protein